MSVRTPEEVEAEVKKGLGRGIKAACIFLSGRYKEMLSVAAPRRLVTSYQGVKYYRALTPATPGAPPRKLSGRLRTSIAYEVDETDSVGRVGTNVIYAKRHELGTHPFLVPGLTANKDNLARIIGTTAPASVGINGG